MTAYGAQYRAQMSAAGANGFVGKPVSFQILASALARAAGQARNP